eukprot:6953644-Prymnesium_polylepis.1
MFESATDPVLALPPGMAPCCAMPGSHVLASWPAWRRRLAFAWLSRAGAALKQNWRATPSGHSRGRCAPTAA